jgi:hypothetical protein
LEYFFTSSWSPLLETILARLDQLGFKQLDSSTEEESNKLIKQLPEKKVVGTSKTAAPQAAAIQEAATPKSPTLKAATLKTATLKAAIQKATTQEAAIQKPATQDTATQEVAIQEPATQEAAIQEAAAQEVALATQKLETDKNAKLSGSKARSISPAVAPNTSTLSALTTSVGPQAKKVLARQVAAQADSSGKVVGREYVTQGRWAGFWRPDKKSEPATTSERPPAVRSTQQPTTKRGAHWPPSVSSSSLPLSARDTPLSSSVRVLPRPAIGERSSVQHQPPAQADSDQPLVSQHLQTNPGASQQIRQDNQQSVDRYDALNKQSRSEAASPAFNQAVTFGELEQFPAGAQQGLNVRVQQVENTDNASQNSRVKAQQEDEAYVQQNQEGRVQHRQQQLQQQHHQQQQQHQQHQARLQQHQQQQGGVRVARKVASSSLRNLPPSANGDYSFRSDMWQSSLI